MAEVKTPLPACDCLTYCGDDPAVAKGLADPCETVKRQRREKSERLAVIEHLTAMATTATKSNAAVLTQAAQLIARYPH
jgi:hypothetical protein